MSHEFIDIEPAHTDFLYKLVFSGDTGVGKSALTKRLMVDEFKTEH